VLAEKVAKGPGRRGGTPAALKDLGEHPAGGGNVTVRDGRYGAYVNFGKVNATLPKGKDPATVTMDEAVALIAAKAEAGGGSAGKGRKAAAKPKAEAKPKAAKPKAAKAKAKPATKKAAK
jgi:DNA topoisomerase-1